MCIACELGLLIAMDAPPESPPPGFPRVGDARFACDAPEALKPAAPDNADERKP